MVHTYINKNSNFQLLDSKRKSISNNDSPFSSMFVLSRRSLYLFSRQTINFDKRVRPESTSVLISSSIPNKKLRMANGSWLSHCFVLRNRFTFLSNDCWLCTKISIAIDVRWLCVHTWGEFLAKCGIIIRFICNLRRMDWNIGTRNFIQFWLMRDDT